MKIFHLNMIMGMRVAVGMAVRSVPSVYGIKNTQKLASQRTNLKCVVKTVSGHSSACFAKKFTVAASKAMPSVALVPLPTNFHNAHYEYKRGGT